VILIFFALLGALTTLWIYAMTVRIGLTGDGGHPLTSPLLPAFVDGAVFVLASLLMLRDRGARHHSKLRSRTKAPQ
jgi:hypothetical protein